MVIWDIEVFSTDLLVISKLIENDQTIIESKNFNIDDQGFFFFFLYIHNDCFCYYIKYNTIKIKKWLVCATNTLECLTNSP
jgi:hypothetical protein